MATSMRYRTSVYYGAALIWLACLSGLNAQQTSAERGAVAPVPRLVWFSGSFRPADRLPVAPVETVTLAVYRDQQGGDALWQETQNVVVWKDGRYDLLMGATVDLFTSGEPRWLGVRFNRAGEGDQPRIPLASVPYALKAADADTLGGKPASAYLLVEPSSPGAPPAATGHSATARRGESTTSAIGSGTAGRLGMFIDSSSLGDSALFQRGPFIGLGTTAPLDSLHVTRVAGAVSRQPGLLLGERSDSTAMVAQSGRVRVKADATYGAIKIGDLLATSPTPRYAMRSRPMRVGAQSLHRPGTLLGKALEPLPDGRGEILVLLTLQ